MAEPLTGMRGTKYAAGTENSLVRDVSDTIYLLQPDDTPLLTFTKGLKNKKVADNPKYEHLEDELLPNEVETEGADGTGTTVNVVAGQGVRVRVGDLLSTPTGESMLVTAISTDAFTVVRSMGAVAAESLVDAQKLIIIGNASEEGADNPPFRYTGKVTKTNYIQIFRDPVELTTTQVHSKSIGGDDLKYQRRKVAIQHKLAIEKAFLVGDAFEYTSGSQTRRGTGGFVRYVTTNVTDIGGTLTQADFNVFLQQLFTYHPSDGDSSKLAILAPILISAIDSWAMDKLQIEQGEKTFGVTIKKYITGHGRLDIVRHWLLGQLTEYNDYGLFVDRENVQYRYLNGLDTKFHTSIQNKYSEKQLDEYRTHCGFQLMNEKTHGILKGVTGYAP